MLLQKVDLTWSDLNLLYSVARQHLMQRLDEQTSTHRDQLAAEHRLRTQTELTLQKRLLECQEQIELLSRMNEASNQSAAARAAAERAAEQAALDAKQYKVSVLLVHITL